MNYTIKAIETRYGGINFRSRLEAKWAALFDLLGWEWTYEPADFNGWIPDFAIHGSRLVYVEVKPVTAFPADVASKMDASGCRDEMLIVGARGPMMNEHEDMIFGWLRENEYGEDSEGKFQDGWWADAVLGRWGSPPGEQIGFCHSEGIYSDRITGGYDGGHFGNGHVDKEEIDIMWREACNKTRWAPT
jgi:hypothetical protein